MTQRATAPAEPANSVFSLIRAAGLLRVEGASVAGRLGFCLWSSTALLYVANRFGVQAAGDAVALFTVAAAVCAAPLSGLFEARARPGLIAGILALNVCACLLVVAAGHHQVAVALLGVLLAGGSSPPAAAVMRSIWHERADTGDTGRFQSAESVLTQICVVTSPALVGFLTAGPLRRTAPVLACCCVVVGCALMWIWSRPTARDRGGAAARTDASTGPPIARLAGLYAIIAGSAMVSGFFNISTAARFAGRPAFPDGPGTTIGAAAVGSIVGGILFTRFSGVFANRWRYPVLMACWALALWAMAVADVAGLVIALAFASGLPVTGIGAEEFATLGRAAGGRSARLFGLANTAISAGVGVGAAISARLIGTVGARTLPAAAASAILVLSVALWPAVAGTRAKSGLVAVSRG